MTPTEQNRGSSAPRITSTERIEDPGRFYNEVTVCWSYNNLYIVLQQSERYVIGTVSPNTCKLPFCTRTTHQAGIDQKQTSSGTQTNVLLVLELRDNVVRWNRRNRSFDQSPAIESKGV